MKRREAQGCHGLGVFDKAVQTSLFRFAGVNQRGQDSNLSIHGNVLTKADTGTQHVLIRPRFASKSEDMLCLHGCGSGIEFFFLVLRSWIS